MYRGHYVMGNHRFVYHTVVVVLAAR